ncbi:HEPN domain-containing protein [Phenylobacterium sp.]|uniref:HEPN domain-containing protein n=1 Tax=Phenylobacterium sp. TaxID=1871053 RepID=UPI0035ADFAB9
MPSKSRKTFEKHLLKDVEQLRARQRKAHPGPGRPSSDLTRSGVFLLCAAWELYAEEVILEACRHVVAAAASPEALPAPVKKALSDAAKSDKHDFGVLRLAGEGWRLYLLELAETAVKALNTPKAQNLVPLFLNYVGIDTTAFFESRKARISEFVAKRGAIAHRGAAAGHVSITDLDDDYEYICTLVRELDNFLIEPVKALGGKRPWNNGAVV